MSAVVVSRSTALAGLSFSLYLTLTFFLQDIYTAAVLAEKLTERHATPPQPWRDMMNTLSEISCDAYRQVVRGDERFVPYFRSATPELELASLK